MLPLLSNPDLEDIFICFFAILNVGCWRSTPGCWVFRLEVSHDSAGTQFSCRVCSGDGGALSSSRRFTTYAQHQPSRLSGKRSGVLFRMLLASSSIVHDVAIFLLRKGFER